MAREFGDANGGHDQRGRGGWRRGRGAWSLALALLTVNAACSGYRPVPQFDPGEQQTARAVEGTPLTRLWRVRPLRGPTAPVARDETTIYLGGSDRRVIAVDLASGKTRWAHRVAGPLLGGVLQRGGVVYAATDRPEGKVHAFDIRSGNELWGTGTGNVEAPLALADDQLLVLNRRGQMLALDLGSGKVRWRRRLPSQRLAPQLLASGVALVTSHDSLYLIRPADGGISLRQKAPGAVTAPWVPFGDLLLAGTGDSLIVALDPTDLSTRWTLRLDAPVLASPVLRGDTILALTQVGSLYRILPGAVPAAERLHPGDWAATGAPASVGPWILAGGSDGMLRALDAATGEAAWQTRISRPIELAPLRFDDSTFLVLGSAGDLHWMHR